jgi:phytoene/squalene synthetase
VLEEVSDPGVARLKLDWWRDEIRRTIQGSPRHPLSHLLAPAVARNALPESAFIGIADRVEAELRRQNPADADALAAQDLADLRAPCSSSSAAATTNAR